LPRNGNHLPGFYLHLHLGVKKKFMKTIIVAVDFSPLSRNAAYYAANLAMQLDAELLLVNVVEVPITLWEVPESGYNVDRMIDDSEEELKSLQHELLAYVHNRIAVDRVTPVGTVAQCLEDAAREKDAFCVVMGMDSVSKIEHIMIRNHALAAIQSLSIPVLIVPQVPFRNIRKMTLAADLADFRNVSALKSLKEWLRLFRAKLDVVSVVKTGEPRPDIIIGSHALQYELADFDPEVHYIYESEVKQAIENFVEQNKPDLLVTMPTKYGFFAGLFHKSQSKQLITQPHIPVLSILE